MKKFIVSKFLNFIIINSRTIIRQVQDFQLVLHDIYIEDMILSESFQVIIIIEKLSQFWKDFKNYLMHK